MKVIVYKKDEVLHVIYPTPGCGLTVKMLANKDVPKGSPYKIIEASDLPEDRTLREAWDIDEAELTDGVGK